MFSGHSTFIFELFNILHAIILTRKRRSKLWASKGQQTHDYQQLDLKKTKQTKNLRKQPEQEQNHRYGDHMEGYYLGGGRGWMGEMVQGLRSITGRYKVLLIL